MSSLPTQTHQDLPANIYKPIQPWEAKVLEHRRLTAQDSPNEVSHIVLNLAGGDLVYVDGQSIGVLPPGVDTAGKPHKLRLYSIASPHIGDDGYGKTVSICVKRAVTVDEATGTVYKGVCSNYLCDLKVGDVVKITGPVGKHFVLPHEPNANMIMVGTGTGIAPFRAFMKTRYTERAHEKGECWLYFGAQTRKDFLYEEEYEQYRPYDTFHLVTAFSREEQNREGGRLYVQHQLQENAEHLFNLLQKPNTYFYMCGLRGMEPGILEGLEKAAASQGISWEAFFAQLKTEKRWLVEVY